MHRSHCWAWLPGEVVCVCVCVHVRMDCRLLAGPESGQVTLLGLVGGQTVCWKAQLHFS